MQEGDTVIFVNAAGRAITCTFLGEDGIMSEVVALGAEDSKWVPSENVYPVAEYKFIQATRGIA